MTEQEYRKEGECEVEGIRRMGRMDVFGRGASLRVGGPLGKASGGKRNRWFVNLLLGIRRKKKSNTP